MAADRLELERIATEWIGLWSAPTDGERFDRLHADSFEDCSSADRGRSKADFGEGIRLLLAAFPDLRAQVEDMVVDVSSGRVAVRWSAVGTNRTPYLDIGPTYRLTHITGIEIIEIRGGQISRRWGEWDITDHRDGP